MIRRLDAQSANLRSSYGHRLGNEPMRVRARTLLQAFTPYRLRNVLTQSREVARTLWTTPTDTTSPSHPLAEYRNLVRDVGLPIRFKVLLAHRTHRNRVEYLGAFLHAYRDTWRF